MQAEEEEQTDDEYEGEDGRRMRMTMKRDVEGDNDDLEEDKAD